MKTIKSVAWCLIVCMLLSVAAPILAYANTGITVISYNGNEIIPQIEPYENHLGLMANAEDLAKLFSLEYDFNSRGKYFHISTEKYGDIYLMHNATEFASGDNIFGCAPNFYFENKIPMVEVGFFCEMFGAKYTVSGSDIVISEKTDADNNPTEEKEGITLIKYNELEGGQGNISGTVTYSPGAPSNGLEIEIILAKYQGFSYKGTYKATTLYLKSGQTSATFSIDPHDVLGNDDTLNFAVGYNIRSIGLAGFLGWSGKDIIYQSDLTGIDPYDLSRFFLYHQNTVSIDIVPQKTFSGTITFDKDVVAPRDGLDITLNISSFSDIRKTNYGQTYRDYGGSLELGTVYMERGTTSKDFAFVIPENSTISYYPNYIVYYTTTTKDCVYAPAYLKTNGNCGNYYYSWECPSDAQLFKFANSNKARINLFTCKSYGEPVKGKAGDKIDWSFDENSGILTLTGRGEMYDDLYSKEWKDYRSKIEKVVIGSGITTIGMNSFSHMSALESVSIPDSVKYIERYAFRNCSDLSEVTLPKYLTEIQSYAFLGCSSLKSVKLPDSLIPEAMGSNVFGNCYNMDTIYAPHKLAATESAWKGSNNYARVYYNCNVTYKVNGRTVKAEPITPGTVIDVPSPGTIPEGGKYYLMVDGKIHTENTITVGANTVIDQVYVAPSSEIKNVVECSKVEKAPTGGSSYYVSFHVESVTNEAFEPTTVVVGLYDSIGNLKGISRERVLDNDLSILVTGKDAETYKIMSINPDTLKPSAFSCEGTLN